MYAQLITYELEGISLEAYQQKMVKPDAPILAKVNGLISKVWLADNNKNEYGGFYLWENKAKMEDFMQSDLVKTVVSRDFVKNVRSIGYEVNKPASTITRGINK